MLQKSDFTIMCAEDEDAIRSVFVKLLEFYFQKVYAAADGEEAWELYKKHKPNIILVDINMPKINGLELVKKIRQNDKDTKIIITTAHADLPYLLEATELHLTKYLVKPIASSDLKSALNIAIDELLNFRIMTKKLVRLREDYSYDFQTEELMAGAKSVVLTKQEKQMLTLLLQHPNSVVEHETIAQNLWGESALYRLESIKTLVKKLRKKLPQGSIENIFGVGYRILL